MRFVEPHAPRPLRKPPEKLQWGQCQFPNVSCRRRQDSRTLSTLRYYETPAQETTEEPNRLNGMFQQFSNGWWDSDGASGCRCPYVRSLRQSLQSRASHVTPLTDTPRLVRLREVRAGECSEIPLEFAAIEGTLPASEVRSCVVAANEPPHRRDQRSLSDSSREAQRRPHRSIRVWAVLSQDDLRGTTVGRIKLDTPCNARFRRIDQNDLGSESLAIKDGGEFDRLSVLQAG